jgi:hypothetical protein
MLEIQQLQEGPSPLTANNLHRTCDKERAKWQRARRLFTLILGCIRPECAGKGIKTIDWRRFRA